MEKWIYILKFRDGRIYKVFFKNKKEHQKIINVITTTQVFDYELISGVTEYKNFESIINTEKTL